jgi:zinc protease
MQKIMKPIPLILGVVAWGLCGLLSQAWAAATTASPTLDKTLPNGLRVVVYEDNRAPTALHMVWLKAGSMDESTGKTGLAHVLEHMMFKGTKTLGPGEFSRRVAALGGRENAFTSKEYTAYFQQIHKDALFEVMALEADRMQNLVISDEEFAKEIKVVMEERRLRTDDSPSGLAYEALMAHAFVASPVRAPIIGWMSDLESLTAQDARDWYAQWYAPNNATVIVAGDVNAQAVFDKVSELYAGWSRKALPEARPQHEPAQIGARHVKVSAPAENPFFIKAWKAPTWTAADGPMSPSNEKARDIVALSVLSTLFDNADFGRLTKRLVRDSRRALSVGLDADGISRGPGLVMLQATPSPGVPIADIERDFVAELAMLVSQGLSADELEIVRRQAKAAEVYRLDSLFSRAMEAGRLVTAGRPLQDSADWLVLLDSITAEDLQRVALKYFVDTQATMVELKPLPLNLAGQPRRGFGANLLRH